MDKELSVEEGQKSILDSFLEEYKNETTKLEPNLYIDIVLVESQNSDEKEIALRLVIPGQALLLDISAIEALEQKLKELKAEVAIANKLNIKV